MDKVFSEIVLRTMDNQIDNKFNISKNMFIGKL